MVGKADYPAAYNCWVAMRQRCLNKRSKRYDGSAICKRWNSFAMFFEDMGDRPAGHALQRLDESKGFSRKNCQWSKYECQAVNRRNSFTITHKGKTQTLNKWSRDTGIPEATIRGRMRRNWSVADALTVEPRVLASYEYLYNNQYKTLSQWAKHKGLCPSLVHSRIKNGWSIERALAK